MIDLGTKRNTLYKGKPPHISALDKQILDVFLAIWILELDALYYDVRVGQGVPIPPETNENMARMFTMNTQRRIDLVFQLTTTDTLYIAEIRPNAGPGALGNALTNYALFTNEDTRPARPAIITDHLAQDMALVLQKFNIALFETFQRRVE